ncbi:MAG: phosphoribosyl-AMP cyclohydrolase [Verrucomicrobiales bacterium]|nr:phosphoribosyl-AMP cyclohydrolase [Verrucomicrobiales bacterium]
MNALPVSQRPFAARESKNAIEEGAAFAPKFGADGLIPAMAVDADSGAPLMLAYMNEESLRQTLEAGQAVYWSRSRNEIWHKGLTSGEFQDVEEILTDCDQDALVLRVRQRGGGCCHTKRATCFYRRVVVDEAAESPTVQLAPSSLVE